MEKDTEKTPVIFRKWADGDIIALFPTLLGDANPANCMSYEHIGQHGVAHPVYVMCNTTPATPEEYKDLFEELESIGYSLEIRRKNTHYYYEMRVEALKA